MAALRAWLQLPLHSVLPASLADWCPAICLSACATSACCMRRAAFALLRTGPLAVNAAAAAAACRGDVCTLNQRRKSEQDCHRAGLQTRKVVDNDHAIATVACKAIIHLEFHFDDEEMSLTKFSARSDKSSPKLTYSQWVDGVSVHSTMFRFSCHVAAMSPQDCANVEASERRRTESWGWEDPPLKEPQTSRCRS